MGPLSVLVIIDLSIIYRSKQFWNQNLCLFMMKMIKSKSVNETKLSNKVLMKTTTKIS